MWEKHQEWAQRRKARTVSESRRIFQFSILPFSFAGFHVPPVEKQEYETNKDEIGRVEKGFEDMGGQGAGAFGERASSSLEKSVMASRGRLRGGVVKAGRVVAA